MKINGTLVVKGDLTISGPGNEIVAKKNFPALVVDNKLKIKDTGTLSIDGYAQIKDKVDVLSSASNAVLNVTGALWMNDYNIDIDSGANVNIAINASPDKAAIELWTSPGNAKRWTPAAAAFYKSIERL